MEVDELINLQQKLAEENKDKLLDTNAYDNIFHLRQISKKNEKLCEKYGVSSVDYVPPTNKRGGIV